jgi:YD repeat-containing protein
LQTLPSSYSWIDGLTYTYNATGQLTQIAESRDVNKGFVTQASGGTGTYAYDGNGNMITDNHKKITISYNYLNLPRKIQWDNGNWIELTYDAAGMKLSKTTNTGVTKNYAGGIEYSGSNLEAIYTSEGRATPNGANYRYEYSIKDHLGNSRLMFQDSSGIPKILKESHYHPFGMEM